MIQRFIELGEGYGDIFELCELARTNASRLQQTYIMYAKKNDKVVVSLAISLKPVGDSKFMPIYLCREGIPFEEEKPSKRLDIFEQAMTELGHVPNRFEIKHSSIFSEHNLYYQYLIGILRLNHYIPPMN